MSSSHRNNIILTAGTMLAVSLIAHFTLLGNHVVHGFVNIFAGGRSNVKLYAFFAYTIVLCVLAILPAIRVRVKNKWLLTSIGLAFGYGLFLLVYFFQKLGLSLSNFIVSFNNSELSTTVITHNHLMKGVLGLFSSSLGFAVQERIDTGWAYVGLIPNALLVLGGVLAVIAGILLVIKFLELAKIQEKWPILLIILYSVVSFSIIKNIIDGGLLNKETPVALTALLFILLPWRNQLKSILLKLSPVLVYLIVMLLMWLTKMNDGSALLRSIFQSLIFGVVILAPIYFFIQKRINRQGILLTILAVVMLYVPVALSVSNYLSLTKPLTSKQAYLGVYKDIKNDDTKLIEKIDDLQFYEYTSRQKFSVSELLLQNNLLDNIGPVTVPWFNCIPSSGTELVTFNLASREQLDNITKAQHRFGNIVKIESQGTTNDLFRYNIIMTADPCAPRSLNLMEALLKERGAKTFFVLNINQLEEQNR